MNITLEFKDYISLIAIIISIAAFSITLYERKLRLSAALYQSGSDVSIDIYNLTSRKLTVSYFELYHSKYRFFFKRTHVNTWYNNGQYPKNLIPAYDSITIRFTDEYKINSFISESILTKHRVYMKLEINGKKYKTLLIR